MPNEALVKAVRGRLPDDGHVQMFDDALSALTSDNQRRAQHFAVTIRELLGHVLSSHAPDDEVRRCVWYKQEEGTRGPTRRQRALYLSRGGLTDDFIRETLELDPDEFHREVGRAFEELNKNTHGRPSTTPIDSAEVEEFADRVIGCFAEILDVVDDVRREIEGCIELHLQDEAASAFIKETIEDLDIIASRYATEAVLFDQARVLEIGSEFVRYQVTGTVDVELQYGGKADAVQIDETFPFTCAMAAKASDPFKFVGDMTVMEVDTSSWHGDDQE
jgi:hypothetical protein